MVEQITVSVNRKVIDYLDKLTHQLYKEEYFSYIENAEQYVLNIYNAITPAINIQKHKQTPERLLPLGELYVTYKSSKRTTWYIFFTKKGNRAVVKFITNNHVKDAGFI